MLEFCSELDGERFPEAIAITKGKYKTLAGFQKLYDNIKHASKERGMKKRLKHAEKIMNALTQTHHHPTGSATERTETAERLRASKGEGKKRLNQFINRHTRQIFCDDPHLRAHKQEVQRLYSAVLHAKDERTKSRALDDLVELSEAERRFHGGGLKYAEYAVRRLLHSPDPKTVSILVSKLEPHIQDIKTTEFLGEIVLLSPSEDARKEALLHLTSSLKEYVKANAAEGHYDNVPKWVCGSVGDITIEATLKRVYNATTSAAVKKSIRDALMEVVAYAYSLSENGTKRVSLGLNLSQPIYDILRTVDDPKLKALAELEKTG